MNPDRKARIRQRAYELWERDGCPEGRAEEYWRTAESAIMIEESAQEVPQAGGPENEPRIWKLAEEAAEGRPPPEAVPPGDPAQTASQAGHRGKRESRSS